MAVLGSLDTEREPSVGRSSLVPCRRAVCWFFRYAVTRRSPPTLLDPAQNDRYCALKSASNQLGRFNFVWILPTMAECRTIALHFLRPRTKSISLTTFASRALVATPDRRSSHEGQSTTLGTSAFQMTGRTVFPSLMPNSMCSRLISERCWTNCSAKHIEATKGGVA
jgi:hypothetical protein